MSKLVAAKKTTVRTILVPVEETNGHMEIASANNSVFELLRKRKSAEISYWGIPDSKSDVLRRRIRIVKQDKKGVVGSLEDIPDLEDIHHTDLPWIGHTTFAQASRQFRSKNVLALVVEVVRQIDGYLFGLRIDSNIIYDYQPPVLITMVEAGPLEMNHKLIINTAPNERQIEAMTPPWSLPPTLVAEMEKIGYIADGNGFKLANCDDLGTRLICELYGKLVIEQ